MKRRCSEKSTKNYLAKGIKVCAQWLDYEVFRQWALAHGYKSHLTIERVRSAGDYEPDNCEWITLGENARRAQADRLLREQALRDEVKTLRAEVELLRREVLLLRRETA
jgi:membrane protein required for beta-lactamase induction